MAENTLKYELPLTTSTGRARVKRRKEEFGEPLKTEDKLSNEDYIEWQISYFLPFDTLWDKFKGIKKNKQKKKLLIEDYFREFKPNNLIQELVNFFEETEEIQRRDFKSKLKEIFEKHKQILIIKEHKDNKTYVMYGTLKEINLKNYSAKVQLFNKRLEPFLFDSSVWESVRDLLESKVEIKFEGKGYNKKLIEIKEVRSYQQKKKMTGEDLLNMGVFGSLSYRDDLRDSVDYARKLGDEALK